MQKRRIAVAVLADEQQMDSWDKRQVTARGISGQAWTGHSGVGACGGESRNWPGWCLSFPQCNPAVLDGPPQCPLTASALARW